MPMPTDRVRRRIERDFPSSGSAEEVVRLIGEWSPGRSVVGVERVHAAIVLLAGGRIVGLRSAIKAADADWRDVLVAADLAESDWPDRLDELFP